MAVHKEKQFAWQLRKDNTFLIDADRLKVQGSVERIAFV